MVYSNFFSAVGPQNMASRLDKILEQTSDEPNGISH